MPSLMYADRAPIHVVQEMGEIRSMIKETEDGFIVLDVCDHSEGATGERVIVRVGAIGSVWEWTPPSAAQASPTGPAAISESWPNGTGPLGF